MNKFGATLLRDIGEGIVAAALAFFLCLLGGKLKELAGEIVAVWIVDGYLLGHVMGVPGRRKIWVFAGGVAGILGANFWVGESAYVASSFTLAGMLEVGTGAWLAPRVRTVAELTETRAFFRFVWAACGFPSLLSGLVAASLLSGIFTNHPFSSFPNWIISDALGILIFAPATLLFVSGEWREVLGPGARLKTLSLLGVLAVVCWAVFSREMYLWLYWVLPPLAILAFQAEMPAVLLGTSVVIAIAVPMTISGQGPFSVMEATNMQERVLQLQFFLLAALTIVLPISITQAQRNRLTKLLEIEHKTREEELQRLANLDALTGLANRRAFNAQLTQRLDAQSTDEAAASVSLLLIDVDHFKAFNDVYGHPSGDACLTRVAQAIADCVGTLGFVARYGGEEFAVIIDNHAADIVPALAETVRSAIERIAVPHSGSPYSVVTISIGALAQSTGSAESVVRAADKALYHAKRSGRNRISFAVTGRDLITARAVDFEPIG